MAATRLTKPLDFVQDILSLRLKQGDIAIDATAGNGRDTLFLARRVAASGTVFAVDLQSDAVTATQARVEAAGLADSVELVQGDHAELLSLTPQKLHGKVQAIMFNLGYLPGSDKKVITEPASTLPALDAAAELLAPGGIISIVVYSGHDGGRADAEAVEGWCRSRDARRWHILQYKQMNRPNNPPYAILAEKLPEYEIPVGRHTLDRQQGKNAND